jgi:DNA-binding XRE family transcriptional regulator
VGWASCPPPTRTAAEMHRFRLRRNAGETPTPLDSVQAKFRPENQMAIRDNVSLGRAIRQSRSRDKLTQTALGDKASVRQRTVSDVERGNGARTETIFRDPDSAGNGNRPRRSSHHAVCSRGLLRWRGCPPPSISISIVPSSVRSPKALQAR